MDFARFANDQPILDQATDVLARVGVGYLVDFVRVKPDFTLSTLQHGRGQAFLQAKIAHFFLIFLSLKSVKMRENYANLI